MKVTLLLLLLLSFINIILCNDIYSIEVKKANGEIIKLEEYRGRVMLIVNLASKCGFTDISYERLNYLHDEYYHKGLSILGFPSNNFNQEPDPINNILKFASIEKQAQWEIFNKIDVKGMGRHPLYKFLKGEHIKENGCRDYNKLCKHWAYQDECTSNPDYMLENCKKSCKQCEPAYKYHEDIHWNFEFFLVSRDGKVIHKWYSLLNKDDITSGESLQIIENALGIIKDL